MPDYFFDRQQLAQWAAQLHDGCTQAEPFPHAVLDNVLDDAVIASLVDEFPDVQDPCWRYHRGENSDKLACGEESRLGTVSRQLIWEMNSVRFLGFLEALTGIEGLVPDPWLFGAGLHQIPRGGFLNIHADFNFHPVWKLDRRINVILYLNSDWKEEYGGHLELWDRSMQSCIRRVLPVANRLVVFQTSDFSYHGHPHPLRCPEGQTRKSISLYYYSNGRPAAEISKEHSTLYQQVPQAQPDWQPVGPATRRFS